LSVEIELIVHLTLTPPPNAPVRKLTLNYDVIAHEIVTHSVLIYERKDGHGGKTSAKPEMLGLIRYQSKSVRIDRGSGPGAAAPPSFWLIVILAALVVGQWAWSCRARFSSIIRAVAPNSFLQ